MNHPILYEGSWSSGTITIDTVTDYESLIVCLGNDTFGRREFEIYRHPTNAFFVGGTMSISSTGFTMISAQITVNNTTLTIGDCYGRKTDGSYAKTVPITRISGGAKIIK